MVHSNLGESVDEIDDDANGIHWKNHSHHALAACCTLLSGRSFLHFCCCAHARVCTALQCQ